MTPLSVSLHFAEFLLLQFAGTSTQGTGWFYIFQGAIQIAHFLHYLHGGPA